MGPNKAGGANDRDAAFRAHPAERKRVAAGADDAEIHDEAQSMRGGSLAQVSDDIRLVLRPDDDGRKPVGEIDAQMLVHERRPLAGGDISGNGSDHPPS
jgi:hypothetical protein